VRPDDSRYGENPNRLQTHTQYQVILKPDPGNPQEIYLDSLRALGIDVAAHDIRFVEDNWASPALGAWGLGWEVWLDGLEITQFTYFQQAGGMTLDPVSVELTYGIERIIMALQGVDHFQDIAYAPGITFGEAFGQSEYEMSRYYLDDADVEANRALFETYAAEAQTMIDQRLPVPAHSFVLKCSHTFNVLDARGAISTTQRAQAFARMRGLSREVAGLWVARREELGHPLGSVQPLKLAAETTTGATESPFPSTPATLLFEIGTEELPPDEVDNTVEAVRTAIAGGLDDTRLEHGEVQVYGTPRRIVVLVEAVAAHEPDAERRVRGPKVTAAYDDDGSPTKALQGFARGQGVDVDAVGTDVFGGTEHVVVTVTDTGRSAGELLPEVLSGVVSGLRSTRNMRWRDPSLSFSRPIRWLTALLGETSLSVEVSALRSEASTRVHRTATEPVVPVGAAEGYLDFLRAHGIEAAADQRRKQIVDQAQQLAATVSGTVNTEAEADLVQEITNLVEQPNALLGSFDQRYLELPEQVLTTVMRKHQRYLPVRSSDGGLLPHFVAVANGTCDHDAVRSGNEAVLRARYEDAAFFWRADRQVEPSTFRERLSQLTFENRLGSVADRADRIGAIANRLAFDADLDTTDTATVHRTAELVKFDLASQMVIELPTLAGVMAREYARHAGEPADVADALFEAELPRHTSDRLPQALPGAVLALADRFDLLMALFSLGAKPTGSSDPFGLRRGALGIVQILRAFPSLEAVTVEHGLRVAAERLRAQGVEVSDDAVGAAVEFVLARFAQQLRDTGTSHAWVNAVLPGAGAPARADQVLAVLGRFNDDAAFAGVTEAMQRIGRIVPEGTIPEYRAEDITEPAERTLVEAVHTLPEHGPGELERFVRNAEPLVRPIDDFFTDVLVMAPDAQVRASRLGLLATVLARAPQGLDWEALG